MRWGLRCLALLVCLAACSSVRIDQTTPVFGTDTYRYFGFVEVIVPKTDGEITAYKIQSLGIALDQGLAIGWRDNEQILVPLKAPEVGGSLWEATCSMIVIIRSDADARHAYQMLSSLKGENICLASFQKTPAAETGTALPD